jgi:hypothetical protein
VTGVHPSDELTLVEAQADGVVGLPLAGLPGRALAGHDGCQAVEVRDHGPVDRFIEGEETRLMAEQLADRDRLLAGLCELRPVGGDTLLVVEPAPRVRECHDHGRQALRRGVDERHRVALPRRTAGPVAEPAPEVHDLPSVLVDAAGGTDLAALAEVLDERLPHALPAGLDRPLDRQPVRRERRHRRHPFPSAAALSVQDDQRGA